MTSPMDTAREALWYRDGNLLYTLQHAGWRKGQEDFKNHLMVRVEVHQGDEAEADALADRLQRFLSSPSVSDTVNAGLVEALRKITEGREVRRGDTTEVVDREDAAEIAAQALAALSRGEAADMRSTVRRINEHLERVPPHHPEAGAPSREDVAYVIQNVKAERVDARGAAWVGEWSYEAADRILALFPTPPDKAVLGGMGERVARIANDMNLVLSQSWDEEQDRDWGAATDELKLDRLDELLGNLLALLSERPAAEEDHSSRAVPLKTMWRPMDTAPKDGSPVIIWDGRETRSLIAYWVPTISTGQWLTRPGCWNVDALFWMPLPAAPALPQDVETKEGGMS